MCPSRKPGSTGLLDRIWVDLGESGTQFQTLNGLGRFFPAFFEIFYNFSYLYFSSLTFLSAGGEYLEEDPLRANSLPFGQSKGMRFMPFGKSMGSAQMKLMAVRQTDLGGGQARLEADYVGEVTGEAAGNHYATFTMSVNEND